jgi:two-component system sensor histidine kinase HydH
MVVCMKLSRPVRYALAGCALGGVDTLSVHLLGIQMSSGGVDYTWPVMSVFGLTFAVGGFIIGHLVDARAQLVRDAATIQQQVGELKATGDQLLQAEKLATLGRMAASVAHEVRNPLAVIRSSAALVAEGIPEAGARRGGDEEAEEVTRFIIDEVDRLDAYVTRILDYARPLVADQGTVALAGVVARAARLVQQLPGSATVEVVGASEPVRGDEDLLVRLLVGLLRNASEAGATQICVELRPGGIMRIGDDGEGLEEAARSQAFEPFFTRKAQGTGLGLALARRIAEAHGGTLMWLEGERTVFELAIPVAEEET